MLYNQLQDAGLNETEAKIYLAALELGQTSVSRIARKAAIKRTTVYLSMENLMQKGLMSALKVSGKTEYYAEDPRNLERIMEERKNRVAKLIPQLLTFTNLVDKKPAFRYFEGEEGIKEVFENALSYPDSEICMMYSESYIYDFDEKYFSEYYVPKRVGKKISTRTIIPDNAEMRELIKNNLESLRQTKFVSPNLFKLKIEIMLYGKNKMSIVSFKEKFAVIIESPHIYQSFKSIFETMWATSAK
jgi:sugar-specific transcriptional regulator TrmB